MPGRSKSATQTFLDSLDVPNCDCRKRWVETYVEHFGEEPEYVPPCEHILAADHPMDFAALLNLYRRTGEAYAEPRLPPRPMAVFTKQALVELYSLRRRQKLALRHPGDLVLLKDPPEQLAIVNHTNQGNHKIIGSELYAETGVAR